jgi:hypothetical protein
MAALLGLDHRSGRPRAVSNGGLGGFVTLQPQNSEVSRASFDSWPRMKRHRPAPIEITHSNEKLLIPATQTPVTFQKRRSLWSPMTPVSANAKASKIGMLDNVSSSCLPVSSRFENSALDDSPLPSLQRTPVKLPAHVFELPGSLLLPSQGFQPPPYTPPRRPPELRQRDSDDSDISPTPSLGTSSLSSGSDMDRFRGRKPVPASNPGLVSANVVSKPFAAMSIEELFEALPKCNSFAITQMWLPAMQNQYSALKSLLQEAAEVKLHSSRELTNIGKV